MVGINGLEFNPELAAVADLRLNADVSSHTFCSPLNNGQAYTSPLVLCGAQPLKRSEDFFLCLRRYTDSVICNDQLPRLMVHQLCKNSNRWFDAWPHKFN